MATIRNIQSTSKGERPGVADEVADSRRCISISGEMKKMMETIDSEQQQQQQQPKKKNRAMRV